MVYHRKLNHLRAIQRETRGDVGPFPTFNMSDADAQREQMAAESVALRAALERAQLEVAAVSEEVNRVHSTQRDSNHSTTDGADAADLERLRVAQARQLEMLRQQTESLMMQRAMLARRLELEAATEPREPK